MNNIWKVISAWVLAIWINNWVSADSHRLGHQTNQAREANLEKFKACMNDDSKSLEDCTNLDYSDVSVPKQHKTQITLWDYSLNLVISNIQGEIKYFLPDSKWSLILTEGERDFYWNNWESLVNLFEFLRENWRI